MSTYNILLSISKRKSPKNIPNTKMSVARDSKRVRNSRGKRAISVRATEVLLYVAFQSRADTLSFLSSSKPYLDSFPLKH